MAIRPLRVSFTPHAPDLNGIALDQTTAGAGNLVLNGADVTGGVASFAATGDFEWVGYQVSLESTGNLSGVDFTITGTDPSGNALVEVIAGPNNNTVETTAYFKTVTQIAVDGAVGTNVEVGTVDEFSTAPIVLDAYTMSTSVAVNISGTIDYTVEKCFENVVSGEVPNWVAGGLATQTADGNTAYTAPTAALRVVGNSFTGGATVIVNVLQAWYL